MRTKTDAAKILMAAGWTLEECNALFGDLAVRYTIREQSSYIASTPTMPPQRRVNPNEIICIKS